MAVNTLEAQKYADGIELDYTPASAVTAGEPIELDGTLGLCGIPNSDIAADAKGSLCIAGVFDILKVTGALTVGDKIGWDANGTPVGGSTTGAATGTVANWDFPIGTCVEDAAEAATSVKVLLNTWRNIDIHEMLPAQAHIADVAATIGTLTGTITPTNAVADTVADITLAAAITDSSGGVDPGNDTIAAITTFSASVSWDGAAVFPSAADETAIAAAITASMAAIAQLAAKANVTRTAISVLEDNQAELVNIVTEAGVDAAALVAKVNAILVALETAGIVASA